jgi:hypothetical protein
MMKKYISLIFFCFLFLVKGFSQQSTDLHEVFLNAESYYLFEEYEEALPLYLRIYRSNPDNYNLAFKIGVCYMNNPYEKSKSVIYLEKAANNINPKYKDSNFKEMGAPLDALFYLGNAYRITNELDKARSTYKKFQAQMDPEIYDDNLLVEQLNACDAAEKYMKKPVDMDAEILSNQINTRFADMNPAVSGDETKMVFISKLQFYDAVFYTELKNGTWTPPRNITPELGVDGDVYPTCLSFDGSVLIVYRNDDFVGNLYTSKLVNGLWTSLVKMNDLINTKYWESHGSLTKDGNTLYFTSNRKGGYGGLDIYRSQKLPDGDWGAPVNLGPTINTSYNEETPFITENDRNLYFSSYGHYNMGGYDVFLSIMKADSSWEKPVNLGYPVNSTDDDIFFCPVKDGEIAYYSVYKETGYGKHDIYRYQVFSADNPRRFDISGILNYSGQTISGSAVLISALNQNTGDTIAVIHPDDSGKFTVSLPAGKYSMVYDTPNFKQEINSLEISQNSSRTGISLKDQITLIPLKGKISPSELDQKLRMEDTLLTVNNTKQLEIEYEAEKGSVVIIRHYVDSLLVKTDTILIDKRRQSFEFSPQTGFNRLEFTLTDKDGNLVTKSVTINTPGTQGILQVNPENPTKTVNPGSESAAEKKNVQENISALVHELSSNTDGRLQQVLTDIDLQKEGITNTEELFRYLYENAGKLGYSTDDVDRLVIEMVSKKDINEFLAQLKKYSAGNLKTAIAGIDPLAENTNTPSKTVEYLALNSKTLLYKPEDLITSLATIGSNAGNDKELFIKKLISSADEGALKVYLKSLDLASVKAGTPQDFAVGLFINAEKNAYTKEDVLAALTNLSVNRDVSELNSKLISLAPDGTLKDFLKKIDFRNEGIYTAEQLINHLYANADLMGFTHEDVNLLLQSYLYNQVGEIDTLRLKMASLATGNLKVYLEKINLNENSFSSREEFINYLNSQASKYGYSVTDVNSTLLKLSYKGDQEDIIKKLIQQSDGNLRKTLENLDPRAEGISTFDGLIRYLIENNEKFGYTDAEVYQMLSDYTAAVDMELFMNELIRRADPETKAFLESVDLKGNNLNSRVDLISFLLKKAAEGSINEDKVIALILSVSGTKATDLLTGLQSRSTGELNRLLTSGKLPMNDFRSAADLYNYLIALSEKNKSISRADIIKLFSESIVSNELNQFVVKLIGHSDGKFREFLLKLDLKESGITSVSGLILYIINNAAQNGYTPDEVYMLIEKVLGRGKLVDFVANLKEYAPIGLQKLLDELDMEKNGINSVEELMKYLEKHAAEYNFTMDDVWDSILQLVISGEDKTRKEQTTENNVAKLSLTKSLFYTVGIFGILAIIIFFLVLLKRRKSNQE